jgi:hypothetical protein
MCFNPYYLENFLGITHTVQCVDEGIYRDE